MTASNEFVALEQLIFIFDFATMINASTLAGIIGSPSEVDLDIVSLCGADIAPKPEVADYPDARYVNYKTLGLSLCYEPSSSSSTKQLTFVDLFNPPSSGASRPRRKQAYDGYASPPLPLIFRFSDTTLALPPPPKPKPGAKLPENLPTTMERSLTFEVKADTTGKEFVSMFGEPTKKGEGHAGYVPPFMEWEKMEIVGEDGVTMVVGVMVELGEGSSGGVGGMEEEAKKGAGVWDRAGDWVWVGLKLFGAGL